MKLNYYDNSWPLTPANSPCDLHFAQYLELKGYERKMIFHFGTGEHHLVGKRNHERGNPNEIIAVTASREEHQAYVEFIIDNPRAANYYKVFFADIYTLSGRMLPRFDLVTLFHLCEYYDQHRYDRRPAIGDESGPSAGETAERESRMNSAYARLNDVKVLEMFLSKLNPGGRVLFFTKSGAYDRHNSGKAAAIVKDFIYRKRIVAEDEYESLLICRRPW